MAKKPEEKSSTYKPENWAQVVYAIPVFAVVPIVSALKPETAPYATAVALAVVGLLFYIVKSDAQKNKEVPKPLQDPLTETRGYYKGLRGLLDEVIKMKSETSEKQDCECYETMINRIQFGIRIYNNLLGPTNKLTTH
jgi:hypothetical protein